MVVLPSQDLLQIPRQNLTNLVPRRVTDLRSSHNANGMPSLPAVSSQAAGAPTPHSSCATSREEWNSRVIPRHSESEARRLHEKSEEREVVEDHGR